MKLLTDSTCSCACNLYDLSITFSNIRFALIQRRYDLTKKASIATKHKQIKLYKFSFEFVSFD